ncbi:MAG: cytochrome c biogenesis protein ResB [Candidatus Limnocylindrales bacterium]
MGAAAWRLLTDVRFAVLLITLLALAGLVGTLVRQFPITKADDPARYAAELATVEAAWSSLPAGSLIVDAFDMLGLFSVFSTPWFLLLMTVLVISIICCTLDRTPRLWRSVSTVRVEQPAAFFDPGREHRSALDGGGEAALGSVHEAFRRRHFRRRQTVRTGDATYVYGDRNQFQKLATLLTHAGLVLFLAGGAITVAAGFETVVFVGEGETAPVQAVGTPGNLLVKNNAFFAPRNEDGSFADFQTDLSVFRDGREIARETVRVNDPLRLEGFVFHQNTFGPAAELTIADASGALVWDGPLLLDDELLGLPQGFMTIPGVDMGLVAVLSEDASGAPLLALQGVGPADPETGQNDTIFLATIPVGVTTDPEVTAGHSITWDAVGSWTGMVIRNDPGQPVIWTAFGLLIVGLALTFYFPRRRAWARVTDERVELAFVADRYVDADAEFGKLTEAVAGELKR